jgi:hypothetical protein
MPRIQADECDNPNCREFGRREPGKDGPEGWIKIALSTITSGKAKAKAEVALMHSEECIHAFMDARFPRDKDQPDTNEKPQDIEREPAPTHLPAPQVDGAVHTDDQGEIILAEMAASAAPQAPLDVFDGPPPPEVAG